MNDVFLSSLGLARRAGKLVFGFETVKTAMQKGEAEVIFCASDISEKTAKEISFLSERMETELVKTAYDMKTLGASIGKMTGIICITDEGFAQMLIQKLRIQEGIK